MPAQPGSPALQTASGSAADDLELSVLAERLPPLLSIIAGMVDLTGFFTLGNIFTAHVTGNLVLAAAAAVRGGPLNLAQALAIPVFIVAVAATWLIAQASPGMVRPWRGCCSSFSLSCLLPFWLSASSPSRQPIRTA